MAGDPELAKHLLAQLSQWIYRSYLTQLEIQGIKALKRQIERRSELQGESETNIKTGRGGIRDIEFVIQFLQLLHGGEIPEVRTPNTLCAIDRLRRANCLTMQEGQFLGEHYVWLRKLEHRLQIMFDLQTHSLPRQDDELVKLAGRMDYDIDDRAAALVAFRRRLAEVTRVNRDVLNHLLHHAFPSSDPAAAAEVDLILDPEIEPQTVADVLGRYRFGDVTAAFRHLLSLSDEKIPFLNPRRSRHFLAAIAPALLAEIGRTPQPDETLVALDNISNSLGGKATLWELFSYNRPSMELCVKLCAACRYLTDILTRNPGMIDGLLDSLTLRSLPSRERMTELLSELTRNAADLTPILNSFKNHMHLAIGVRDILDRDDVREVHKSLADVAELCLQTVAEHQLKRLVERFGQPTTFDGRPCELVIIAMGKLGGREPNYHSDLDVIFLYQDAANTSHASPERQTTNQHFFSELATKIITGVSTIGPHGKLFELDCRLRPTGKSGSLAVSYDEFERYFASGSGQTWERLALCKARPIFGSDRARDTATRLLRRALTARAWQENWANEIRGMRYRMQEGADPQNIKRGIGGTVDIEFIVQMLQLKHAAERPNVVRPGTVDGLIMLSQHRVLSLQDCQFLIRSYRFLRTVEARIRLMNATARHDFPKSSAAQGKLAYLLNRSDGDSLLREVDRYRRENRMQFERIFDAT